MAAGSDDTPDDAALRARLDTLSKSLGSETAAEEAKSPVEDATLAGAMGLGVRVLTEFVAGIGVGALVGWQLDTWLHTSPLLLIVFLTLGTAAGFWNVYRLAAKPSAGAGGRRRGPL